MQFLSSLSPIADRYSGILLDLWGCLHDGSGLYPGAYECLVELRRQGKKIVMLSNAPRRAAKAQIVLDRLGVDRALYDGLITSGEAGYEALRAQGSGLRGQGQDNLADPRHPTPDPYFFIGPERDADVLNGLPYQAVLDIKDANFILNAGFGTDQEALADWHGPLKVAAARRLPMLCLNPDMEVVKISGERFPCAGVIAREYEQLGGAVTYFGKPYPEVYEKALQLLTTPKDRILAVGDGLHTDILGAQRAGVAAALVTGGILQQELGEVTQDHLRTWLQRQDVQPNYVLPALKW